eukprot:9577786-Lingulodinium_polyedra.AAC.1
MGYVTASAEIPPVSPSVRASASRSSATVGRLSVANGVIPAALRLPRQGLAGVLKFCKDTVIL